MRRILVAIILIGMVLVAAGCGTQSNNANVPAGMKVTNLPKAQMDAVAAHMAKVRGN